MENKKLIFALFFMALLFSGLGVFVVNAVSNLEDGSENHIRFYKYANGLGASGYDVVAYFEENRAIVGDKKYTANFSGMEWRFSTSARRDKFIADPLHYLPRYGGHCAYGVAGGYLVRGDPTAWSIRNGVLYFNYNKSVRSAWLADVEHFIRQGENNWPQLNK